MRIEKYASKSTDNAMCVMMGGKNVYWSYDTIVAVSDENHIHWIGDKKWSQTTNRHINAAIKHSGKKPMRRMKSDVGLMVAQIQLAVGAVQ